MREGHLTRSKIPIEERELDAASTVGETEQPVGAAPGHLEGPGSDGVTLAPKVFPADLSDANSDMNLGLSR